MILDGYWKQDLHRIKNELLFWSKGGAILHSEYAEQIVSKCLLYSASIIRKTVEDEEDARKAIGKDKMPIPALPVSNITVPITRYQHTDEDKFFVNSRVFLDDYDLQNGQATFLTLKQACNQVIHSYAWAIVHDGKRHIYGALVASETKKEENIILLTIFDWINAIQKVIDTANI